MLTLTSPAFSQNEEIPARYTCQGENVSPPLQWSNPPPGTESLALILDDPDAPDPAAPQRTWVHWVLYNLPPHSDGLSEGMTAKTLPEGTKEGRNDWDKTGYGGPCPPVGKHRYFHKLYALNTVLEGLDKPNKAQLEEAMKDHIVGRAELMGTCQAPE